MHTTQPVLSIVSPVYRAENLIAELVRRTKVSTSALTEDYEIILVDDWGPDNSRGRIDEQAAHDERVRGVRLSRNSGQHKVITAGLAQAWGEWIVMHCDSQDQLEEILGLYHHAV